MFSRHDRASLPITSVVRTYLCQSRECPLNAPEPLRVLYSTFMNNSSRFDLIMARVDEWAENNAGWDCRAEAEADVMFCLYECSGLSDDEVVESAIAAWEMAE